MSAHPEILDPCVAAIRFTRSMRLLKENAVFVSVDNKSYSELAGRPKWSLVPAAPLPSSRSQWRSHRFSKFHSIQLSLSYQSFFPVFQRSSKMTYRSRGRSLIEVILVRKIWYSRSFVSSGAMQHFTYSIRKLLTGLDMMIAVVFSLW